MLTSVMGFVAVMLAATFSITSISNTYHQVDLTIQEQNRSMLSTTVIRQTCLPEQVAAEERVKGLAWDFKALPFSSDRLSFDGQGVSVSYRISASPQDVADFYLQQTTCGQRIVFFDGNIYVTQEEGGLEGSEQVTVRVASVERVAGVSRVEYELGTLPRAVLGDSVVRLVQETTPTMITGTNENPSITPQGFIPFKPGEFGREPQRMPFDQQGGERPMKMNRFDGASLRGQETGDQEQGGQDQEQVQLKMMQQQMEKMKLEVARVKKQMENVKAKLKKSCNLDLPEDITNALSSVDQLMVAVGSATDAPDAQNAMEDLRDAMQTIREGGMDIQRLFQMCEQLRRLASDVKRMDRESSRLISQADKSENAGIKALGQDLKSTLTALKDLLASVNTAATTDDKETAVDQVFEEFESVNDAREALQLALEVKKNLTKMKTELRRVELEIAKAAKTGKDVTEVKTTFESLKTAFKDLETLVGGSYTKDQLVEAVEKIHTLRGELRDQMDLLLGRSSEFEPTVKVNEPNIQFSPSNAFISGLNNQ